MKEPFEEITIDPVKLVANRGGKQINLPLLHKKIGKSRIVTVRGVGYRYGEVAA